MNKKDLEWMIISSKEADIPGPGFYEEFTYVKNDISVSINEKRVKNAKNCIEINIKSTDSSPKIKK